MKLIKQMAITFVIMLVLFIAWFGFTNELTYSNVGFSILVSLVCSITDELVARLLTRQAHKLRSKFNSNK